MGKYKSWTEKEFRAYLFFYAADSNYEYNAEEKAIIETKLESKTLPTADEAFIFEISEKNEDSMILTWSLKENCFLYKEKFKLVAEGKEISSFQIIGEPNKINDVYFGEVDVYFDSVSIILSLNEGEKEIDISYQGCNEKGFCYPPIEKKLLLDKYVKF